MLIQDDYGLNVSEVDKISVFQIFNNDKQLYLDEISNVIKLVVDGRDVDLNYKSEENAINHYNVLMRRCKL